MSKQTQSKSIADCKDPAFIPSFSFLKSLAAGNPEKARFDRIESKKPGAVKDWQIEGKAIEAAIFAPEAFEERFAVMAKIPDTESTNFAFCSSFLDYLAEGCDPMEAAENAKRSSGHRYKAATLLDKTAGDFSHYFDFIRANMDGKTIITHEIQDKAFTISKKLMKESPLPEFLDGAELNKKVEWVNPASGVKIRGEIDLFKPSLILDFKTDRGIEPGRLGGRYGYLSKFKTAVQLVAYEEAIITSGDKNPDRQLLVFSVEKSAPYSFIVREISQADKIRAQEEWDSLCQMFKHIKGNDLWQMGYQYGDQFRATPEGVFPTDSDYDLGAFPETEIYY
jgi:hypothetical protein